MAILELYGKCKELGYCDCGGFFGCQDPTPPLERTNNKDELRNAMEAERQTTNFRNSYNEAELEREKFPANEPLVAMVECTVCDRSHAPSHPHIANIDGDIPIDDSDAPVEPSPRPAGRTIPPRAGLPSWLKDESRDAADRVQTTCEACGKIKRSNHKCKGQPTPGEVIHAAEKCEHCEAARELCVRHGGRWSDYDTVRSETDERAAKTLPAPVSVTQPVTTDTCRNGHLKTPENGYIRSDGRRECKQCKKEYKNTARPALPAEADRELAAIGTILAAVDGLGPEEVQRAFAYVADRKGIKEGIGL